MWVSDIDSKIFTLIKARTMPKLRLLYPNIDYTSSSLKSAKTVKFPTIYIHRNSVIERNQDIEGSTVNAIMYDLQIEVTTDTSENDINIIFDNIIEVLKEVGFEINQFPIFNNTTHYFAVMRARRIIGQGDKF